VHLLRGRLPLATTLLIVLIGSVFLLLQARHLWFLGDDWDFLLGRDLSENPVSDAMRPHNEHWSTVPVVIFRSMFTIFGLEHYLAFALLPILAHAAVCVLLYLLLQRCGIRPWTAVAVVGVMVFLGAGAENMLWDFQVGMLGSAVFGLAALLLSMRGGHRAVAMTWSLSVLSLMSSGTALPMLAWLGAFTLLHNRLRAALVLTLPPAMAYAGWYIAWGRHHLVTYIAPTPLEDVVPLAWSGLSATWSSMSGIAGAGSAILLALIAAALVLPAAGSGVRALAVSGVLAALAAFLAFAHSRGSLGLEQVSSSRYLYFGALMTLPALAALLDSLVERLPAGRAERGWTVGILVGALIIPGAFGVVTTREGRASWTAGLEVRVVAAADLAQSGAPLLGTMVDPSINPQIKIDELTRPDVLSRLPDVDVTPFDRLGARASLQVAASPSSWGLPEAKTTFQNASTTSSGECLIGVGGQGSVVEMHSGDDGAQVRLTLSATDRTTVRLRDGDVTSAPLPLVVGDTTEVYVGVTAPDVDLLVDLPPGSPFTVCGR